MVALGVVLKTGFNYHCTGLRQPEDVLSRLTETISQPVKALGFLCGEILFTIVLNYGGVSE